MGGPSQTFGLKSFKLRLSEGPHNTWEDIAQRESRNTGGGLWGQDQMIGKQLRHETGQRWPAQVGCHFLMVAATPSGSAERQAALGRRVLRNPRDSRAKKSQKA